MRCENLANDVKNVKKLVKASTVKQDIKKTWKPCQTLPKAYKRRGKLVGKVLTSFFIVKTREPLLENLNVKACENLANTRQKLGKLVKNYLSYVKHL